MSFARILVKDNYEQRGDLVLRSYIRAVKKLKVHALLCHDLLSNVEKAYIYGEIKEDNKFHEFFTDRVIDYDDYEIIPDDDIEVLRQLPLSKIYQVKQIFDYVLFNRKYDGKIEVSSEIELAEDRVVEEEAYSKFLSVINSYMRLGRSNNKGMSNAYNNFLYKVKVVNKIKELDNRPYEFDQYDVDSYVEFKKDSDFALVKRIK